MSDLEGMALVLAAHQRDPHSSGAVNTLSLEVYRKKTTNSWPSNELKSKIGLHLLAWTVLSAERLHLNPDPHFNPFSCKCFINLRKKAKLFEMLL